MKKYKICYVDDLSFALPQLILSLPSHIDYSFEYCQRIIDIIPDDYDIVLLDFYLDKDGKTALDIIEKFFGTVIISFSTSQEKNKLMLDRGAIYAAEKLRGTNENMKLKNIFQEIFSK